MSTQLKHFYERRKTDLSAVDERMMKVVEHVASFGPSRLLDLACGRGTMLGLLREALPGVRLRGADISDSSVQAARDRGFDAVQGDAQERLPFEDGSFDCVVFGEVIEHVIDPDACLIEIARVLRVGGTLVLTTPNLASWFNRLLLVAGIQPIFTETSLHSNLGRKTPLLGQWGDVQGHLKIFTLPALKDILVANGYRVTRLDGAPFPRKSAFSVVDNFMTRVPSLASNFVVSAISSGQKCSTYPTSQLC